MNFTAREIEVVKWMADGKTSDEISIILGISHITVNSHKQTMMRKAGVYKDTALVATALRQHIID